MIISNKLYGGDFEYYASKKSSLRFNEFFNLKNNHKFFSSGSNALSYIFRKENLKNKKVLVPNYCCWSSILPIIEEFNCKLDFYNIKNDLSLEIPKITNADAIIIINYFGINDYKKEGLKLRKTNPEICIILDNVQALFELKNNGIKGKWANWQFFSFRKFLPSPGGGLALHLEKQMKPGKPIITNYDKIWNNASKLKKSFLSNQIRINEIEYLKEFEIAKYELRNSSKIKISKLSYDQINLQSFKSIAHSRIRNYKILYNALSDLKETKYYFYELGKNCTPLFFPLILINDERKTLLNKLKSKKLFCPIHWPLTKSKFTIKLPKFNDNIISIPIDQRYSEQDIRQISELLRE